MKLNRVFFVGFTTEVTRPELVVTPMAPANFRDPVKIKEKVQERIDLLQPRLSTCPGVATITAIDIYNWYGKPVFNALRNVSSPFKPPAVQFWEWLNSSFHFSSGPTLDLIPEEFVSPSAIIMSSAFFGFRIKSFMQIAAMDAMLRGEDGVPPKVKIPVQIWHDHVGVCDPYEALFTPEQRKIVSLGAAIGLLHNYAIDEESLYQKPRNQAMLAHTMTVRAQLLGTDPEEYLDHGEADEEETSTPWDSREAGAAAGG
jgi:hypothetical protein